VLFRSTDMGVSALETAGERIPRPVDPLNVRNPNAPNAARGIQEATGDITNPALEAQKMGILFRESEDALSQIRKTGTSGQNQHVGDIGKRVYAMQGVVTEKQSWLTEEVTAGRMTPEQARPFQNVLTRHQRYIDEVLLPETMTIRRTAQGPLEDVSVRGEYNAYRAELEADILGVRTSGRQPTAAPGTVSILPQTMEVKIKGSTGAAAESREPFDTTPLPTTPGHLVKPFGKDIDVMIGRGRGVPEAQVRTIARAAGGEAEFTDTWWNTLTGLPARGTPLQTRFNQGMTRIFGEVNPESFNIRLPSGTVMTKEQAGLDIKITTSTSPPTAGTSRFPYWGFVREIPSQAAVPFQGIGTMIFGSPHIVREKAHEYTKLTISDARTIGQMPTPPSYPTVNSVSGLSSPIRGVSPPSPIPSRSITSSISSISSSISKSSASSASSSLSKSSSVGSSRISSPYNYPSLSLSGLTSASRSSRSSASSSASSINSLSSISSSISSMSSLSSRSSMSSSSISRSSQSILSPPSIPSLPSGGGGSSYGISRRSRKYLEIFPVGLDISFTSGFKMPKMKAPKAMKPIKPRGVKGLNLRRKKKK
jgi:hypothetical protein